jgi:adenosine kinase
MKTVLTGSIAYDYLMTFPGYFREHILPDHLDNISLSFLVDTMVRQRGGVAPNIAYNLALLGEKPILLGTVGDDFDVYRIWLESKGINTSHIKVIPGEFTASFFANTDLANSQIASFYTGAMAYAADLSLQEVISEQPDLVVISPNDPTAMELYTVECQEMNIPYLYDPSQQIVRIKPEKLRQGVLGAKHLFVNEYEFELLQKHTGLKEMEIRDHIDILVVTLGEKGATVYTNGKQFSISPVKPDKIADPTGVGDAFRAGFLKGLSMELDPVICGQIGALAATYCLEQRGTQNHSYTISDFVERYRLHFNDQGTLNLLIK